MLFKVHIEYYQSCISHSKIVNEWKNPPNANDHQVKPMHRQCLCLANLRIVWILTQTVLDASIFERRIFYQRHQLVKLKEDFYHSRTRYFNGNFFKIQIVSLQIWTFFKNKIPAFRLFVVCWFNHISVYPYLSRHTCFIDWYFWS